MAENGNAQRVTHVPRLRWQLPFVMLVTVCFSYLDRMNISYALPKIALDYGWTVKETGAYGGLLMSMFYVGYGLSNIFLSPIAERFGPRKSIIVVILLFSFFTMLGAPCGMMFTAFIAIRILLGLGEGTHFPMINVLTKRWFPTNERSRANGIWVLGIFGSMIIAPFLVVPVIETWGWRTMFIVLGCMGIFIIFLRNPVVKQPTLKTTKLLRLFF
jgi:MFS family permease